MHLQEIVAKFPFRNIWLACVGKRFFIAFVFAFSIVLMFRGFQASLETGWASMVHWSPPHASQLHLRTAKAVPGYPTPRDRMPRRPECPDWSGPGSEAWEGRYAAVERFWASVRVCVVYDLSGPREQLWLWATVCGRYCAWLEIISAGLTTATRQLGPGDVVNIPVIFVR